MALRVGSLTVRHPYQYTKTPSGVIRPGVFAAGTKDFAERRVGFGRTIERCGNAVVVRGLRYTAPTATPDQITALEYAKACNKLDNDEAGRRARTLLFRYLTPDQRKDAQRYNYFDIWLHNPHLVRLCLHSRIPVLFHTVMFRIWRGFPNGNVMIGLPEEGFHRWQLCLHPATPYPTDDICLGQLTLILQEPETLIELGALTPAYENQLKKALFTRYRIWNSSDLVLPHLKGDSIEEHL